MKKYDTILFDWDGSLADTLSIWLTNYISLFKEFDIKITRQEIITKVFGNWDGPAIFGVTNLDKFNSKLLQETTKLLTRVIVSDQVKQILKFLKNNSIKTALVTSSSITAVSPALKNNQIEQYFDVILTAEDVDRHKPDPQVLLLAMQKMNSAPQKTLMVGDSKNDILAAQNANIDGAAFFPDFNNLFYSDKFYQEINPTHIIKDILELKKLV